MKGYGTVGVPMQVAAVVSFVDRGLPYVVASIDTDMSMLDPSDWPATLGPADFDRGVAVALLNLADKGVTDVRVVYPVLS